MDAQLLLDFDYTERMKDELEKRVRQSLAPCRLPRYSLEVLVLCAREAERREVGGHQVLVLSISKRKAGKLLGCAPNTFINAVADLVDRRVMSAHEIGNERFYIVSPEAVAGLAPVADDPLAEVRLDFDQPAVDQSAKRSTVVSGGQIARVREHKNHLSRERVPGTRDVDGSGTVDHPPASNAPRRPPGRVTLRSLTDDQVRRLDWDALRSAFYDACQYHQLNAESLEDKTKFLAVCHHAAVCSTINHPARAVYASVAKYDFERVNQASWDWARAKLKPREYAEAN